MLRAIPALNIINQNVIDRTPNFSKIVKVRRNSPLPTVS